MSASTGFQAVVLLLMLTAIPVSAMWFIQGCVTWYSSLKFYRIARRERIREQFALAREEILQTCLEYPIFLQTPIFTTLYGMCTVVMRRPDIYERTGIRALQAFSASPELKELWPTMLPHIQGRSTPLYRALDHIWKGSEMLLRESLIAYWPLAVAAVVSALVRLPQARQKLMKVTKSKTPVYKLANWESVAPEFSALVQFTQSAESTLSKCAA